MDKKKKNHDGPIFHARYECVTFKLFTLVVRLSEQNGWSVGSYHFFKRLKTIVTIAARTGQGRAGHANFTRYFTRRFLMSCDVYVFNGERLTLTIGVEEM